MTSLPAFGIIREQLNKHIGENRVKDFLFQFGWEMGVHDAKKALKTGEPYDVLVKYGPILHMENGHITGAKHKCTVEFDDQNQLKSVYGRGEWHESYEAVEHIRRHGLSPTPVCHTLIGFASGYMSTIFGKTLLAKEYKCVGKGDKVCTWIVRTKKEWEERGEHLDYNQPTIIQELRYTYDQLLDQKDLITRLAQFQKKIMEEVSRGSDLQNIANLFYKTTHIPVIIQSLAFQHDIYSGLSEEQYHQLNEDLKISLVEQRNGAIMSDTPFKKQTIKTELQQRVIIPIRVQNKVLGSCAFIFNNDSVRNFHGKESYLFLDSFANAASLVLLNEKTKVESFERIKGHFLEQILHAHISVNEMISKGMLAGVCLRKPYYIVVLRFQRPSSNSFETEFLLLDELYETILHFFVDKKHKILLTQRDSKFILLLPHSVFDDCTIKAIINDLNHYVTKKNALFTFKIGVSSLGENIADAAIHYEEASIAAELATKKQIVFFQDLGIFGVLINSRNVNGIKMIAKQKLGPLYQTSDEKNQELLKTLYVFLLNGGNLRETKEELSLSMSGLRHRLTRIESLLDTELRDPNEAHELLLIIKSLIAIDDLNFNLW